MSCRADEVIEWDAFAAVYESAVGANLPHGTQRTLAASWQAMAMRFGFTSSVTVVRSKLEHSHETTLLKLCDGDKVHDLAWRAVRCLPVETNWELFVDAVRAGQGVEPSFRRAAHLQKVLDLCFDIASQASAAVG